MKISTQESTIEQALESMRPFLRKDGGDVELVSYDNHVVKLKLLGACSTCSISHLTMKAGLEESIKNMLPEVKEVIAVD